MNSADFDLLRLERRTSLLPYPHRHDYYQVVWIVSGTGSHVIDSVVYPVKENSIFFMSPRQIHDFQLSDDTTGFTLNFSAEFFFFGQKDRSPMSDLVFFRSEHPLQTLYLRDDQSAVMRTIIESMEEEYRGKSARYLEIIRAYLYIFLLKASRFANVPEVTGTAHRSFFLTQKFRMLLETEPLVIGPLRRYAEKLHVTERHLSDATRIATGLSASELIHQRVVLEAKRMLAHSELHVTSVAVRLGFEDPSYFSRFFKKYVGLSPRDFKRQATSSSDSELAEKSN